MALIGIGGTVAAFLLFGGLGGVVRSGSSDPFDAMPRGSFIVGTVDFAELRQSPLYQAVFGHDSVGSEPMRRALGVGMISDACGFDPLTRVQRFAVAVPEEGERGEFGVAARVEVSREELERCTRSLADRRGEHAETHDVGSFVVLEDTSAANDAAPGHGARPRLAYGRGGLLVVGKGTWFDAMLGAADHVKPGARDAPEHAALRTSLTSHEGFHAPTLLATALLPRALRERLKGDMGADLDAENMSSAIMAGVLGVSSVGVAIVAGAKGGHVDAAVELVCDSPDACEAVEKLVLKKRRDWSGDLRLRMVGFGPLIDSFEVKRDGARLRATARAGAEELSGAIERVLKLRGGGGGDRPPPNPGRPRPPPQQRPDENIRARSDAGP